jgi:hypothetical protein
MDVNGEGKKGTTAMTVRIPNDVMERLRIKLAQDQKKFQTKALELFTAYVNGVPDESEHDHRMKIAREEMERFRESFQILSK